MNDQPDRPGALLIVALAALAALVVVVVGGYKSAIVDQRTPAYLATALYADSAPVKDANLLVYADGTVKVQKPQFDTFDHATAPDWKADLGPLPFGRVPFAPAMNWGVSFMQQVADGKRGLRFCVQERRAFDQAHGTNTADIGIQTIREEFDQQFVIPASVEDCQAPDLVLGANATQDCGAGAWGCAALLFSGQRPYVRVTFAGELVAAGTIPLACVRAIDEHEDGHAGDLGHTGEYGGEGRPHPHRSNMGYINSSTCTTVDNPGGGNAPEDWATNEPGHPNRWGLTLRGAGPNPQPTATPAPTPSPTPTAAPRPVQLDREQALGVLSDLYYQLLDDKAHATSFNDAVTFQLRAEGVAIAYWTLADAWQPQAGAAPRSRPAPPRP